MVLDVVQAGPSVAPAGPTRAALKPAGLGERPTFSIPLNVAFLVADRQHPHPLDHRGHNDPPLVRRVGDLTVGTTATTATESDFLAKKHLTV